MNKLTLAVLGTFAALLLITGALAYAMRGHVRLEQAAATSNAGVGTSTATPQSSPRRRSRPTATARFSATCLARSRRICRRRRPVAGRRPPRPWACDSLWQPCWRRYSRSGRRRGVANTRRNPYVGQTQILMAVVAAAMMMVVGDSAARAFGIFAAASLVRFRTNIRDPKEITVLLVCLGVGLAAGVGRWDMAVILSAFVLVSLAVLEWFEQAQIFRSMEVSVSTKNADTTHEALKQLFRRHRFDMELRELNRPDEEKPMGKIVYLVNLKATTSTDRLSEEILASDRDNIDSVEWQQKDSQTYIYK